MRTILSLLLMGLTAMSIQAQTPLPAALLNSSTNDSERLKPNDKTSAATPDPQADQKKVVDAKFTALMLALQVSTVADIESTYHALGNCPPGYTCREGNPLMRPFIQSGRPAAYAFTTGVNGLVMWHSYRLKKRGSRWWWVGPAIQIGIHTFAAVHNYRTASRPALGPLPVR